MVHDRGRDRPDRDHRRSASKSSPTTGCPARGPAGPRTATSCSTSSRSPRPPRPTPSRRKPVDAPERPGRLQPGELRRRRGDRRRPTTRGNGLGRLAGDRRRPTGRRSRPSEPVGGDGGTVLTFKLHHQFRQAATRSAGSGSRSPTCQGRSAWACPRTSAPILGDRARAADRGPAERAAGLLPRRSTPSCAEAGRRRRTPSKAPLPVDPKLKELRDQLAEVEPSRCRSTRGSPSCGRTSR